MVDRVECPKKAKRCTIPHLTIADTPAGEGERLIVVELPEEGLPKVKIGDHLQITGKFDRSSSDGLFGQKATRLRRDEQEGNALAEEIRRLTQTPIYTFWKVAIKRLLDAEKYAPCS